MAEAIAGARSYIELPEPEPLGGGVMSVARVIDVTDTHDLLGVEAQTDACATAEEWTEWCTMSPTGSKLFEGGPDVVAGDPFAVYAGVECTLQQLTKQQARAERRLSFAEARAVDMHIAALVEATGLDIGGPLAVAPAIGVAEAFAATVYGGAPTILVPRQLLGCLCNCLQVGLNGALSTYGGARVVPLTAPLTLPVSAMPGGSVYVTGQITLLRGNVIAISVPQQVAADGTYSPARALAERIYVPVFDCLVAKIDVTCESTP